MQEIQQELDIANFIFGNMQVKFKGVKNYEK